MPEHDSAPPTEARSTDAEEAVYSMATGETLRGRGELAEAATWYRRAANHWMEAGEDARAIDVAKLAAELAALDDAGRPSSRASTAARPGDVHAVPKLPWDREAVREGGSSSDVVTTPPARPDSTPDSTPPSGPPTSVSPLAAMVDEAVLSLPSARPHVMTSGAPRLTTVRPSAWSPARIAEAEQIGARLAALPLFSELPTSHLRDLARQAAIVRFDAGDYLCEAGAPEGPMYTLTEGTASIGLVATEGSMATVSAGDYVGEISALFGGPRTASVMAQGTVETVVLPASVVRGLARAFAPFRESIETTARERLAESLPSLTPMLSRFDVARRRDLFARFEIVVVEEGGLIVTEGLATDGLYIVAAGEAEVYGGSFGVVRAQRVRPGEVVGIAAMLHDELAGASVRASRRMMVARLPRAGWSAALVAHPSLGEMADEIGVLGRGVVV